MSDLPDPKDPLVTRTGMVVYNEETETTDKVTVEEYNARQRVIPFDKFQPAFEMTQDTMPEADAKDQITLASIIGLRLMGLPLVDISDMFGVAIGTLEEMIKRPSTQKTFERMFQGIVSGNSSALQGRLVHFGNNAIDVMAGLMNDDETRDDVRLKAAQDFLDRAGTNPDNFFAKDKDSGNAQDDELRIVMMDETGTTEKMSVEISRKKS